MLVIGLGVVLLALGAAAFFLSPRPGSAPNAAESAVQGPGSGPADRSAGAAGPAAPADGADAAPAIEDTPRSGPLLFPTRRRSSGGGDPLAALDPTRFEGNGRIRVRCSTPEGVPFPDRWVLHLGPARALLGSEHAETRVVEVEGERQVELEGLALGGYELRATAALMNSDAMLLMLSKPSHTDLVSELTLLPAGYVTGTVVDSEGRPVEGFELSLESLESGQVKTVATDVGGGYLFNDVVNGDYRLFVGDPKAPLRDPVEIAYRAPSLTMRPFEVPALCELEVVVYDGVGLVIADALVQGWSKEGGRIEGRTDNYGRLSQRFLPEGEYTLIGSEDRLGRTRSRVTLTAGEPIQAELKFDLR